MESPPKTPKVSRGPQVPPPVSQLPDPESAPSQRNPLTGVIELPTGPFRRIYPLNPVSRPPSTDSTDSLPVRRTKAKGKGKQSAASTSAKKPAPVAKPVKVTKPVPIALATVSGDIPQPLDVSHLSTMTAFLEAAAFSPVSRVVLI
jgi:hypothetical protein